MPGPMLFLTDDNEFAGDNTHLTVEETKASHFWHEHLVEFMRGRTELPHIDVVVFSWPVHLQVNRMCAPQCVY